MFSLLATLRHTPNLAAFDILGVLLPHMLVHSRRVAGAENTERTESGHLG